MRKSLAQPRILKSHNKSPVQTAPAQEGLGRIGRTKESKGRISRDLSEGDRSLFKEERRVSLAEVSGYPSESSGGSLCIIHQNMITLDQPWRGRREKREVEIQ